MFGNESESNALPEWTRNLIAAIKSCWKHQGEGEQLKVHVSFSKQQRIWRVFLSPFLKEVVGGENDGEKYWTPFVFEAGDFSKLPRVEIHNFAVASRCGRSALTEPRMMMVGKYRGHRVFIQILLEPQPADDESEIPF